MQTLRKILAISVIFVTVMSLSVAVAPQAKAAASAGDLVKISGSSAIYYLGADSKLYVFPNEATYFSWYSDFSQVVTIPADELSSYGLPKANVTMRPGTKLVKRPLANAPEVYAVEPGGQLRHITDEATASSLYGSSWAKRVVDIQDSIFTSYQLSSKGPVTATAYPAGSLVKTATSPSVYYIDATNAARKIATETAFSANRFSFDNVLTTTMAVTATGTDITGAESALIDTASGAGGVIPQGGSGLTVALSGTTAPSATIVAGSNLAELASFNFTASQDGAVKVNTVKVKKVGIASDSTLTDVYLFDGAYRLTDAGSLSSGVVTFSNGTGIFTVPAGQTKTITVKANVAGSVSGQTVGASIADAAGVSTNGATVSGSFPVSGNQMSIATVSSPSLSTVTLTGTGPTGTSVQAGTMSATVFTTTATVTTKAATLKSVRFVEVGSAPTDALQNIKLFVAGVQAGSAATIDANGNIAFDLSAAPVTLNTGANTIEVRADIVKGSSRTFALNIQDDADVTIIDGNYGVALPIGGTPPTGGCPTSNQANTISAGSISVSTDPSFTASQVVKNTAGVTLAKYTMKAYGEDMKVQTLNVIPTITYTAGNGIQPTEGLSNVSLFVNGSQVGSSKNYIATVASTSPVALTPYGSTNLFTIPAGTTVTLEIKADLTQLNPSYFASVKAQLQAAAGAYIGVSSVSPSPSVQQTYAAGPQLSVINGALAISKNTAFGTPQNVLANTSNRKIGSYVLQAGTAEPVRISNIRIDLSGTAVLTDLSNLYTSVNTTPVQAQSQNNFPVNITLPAGGTQTVDVFADLGNITTGSTTITTIVVTATGVSTGNSVGNAANPLTGQTMLVQAGTLTGPSLVSNAPVSALVTPSGATPTLAATYKFVATNGAATISEIIFNVTDLATTSPSQAIGDVTVGGNKATVVADLSGNMVADVAGLNIVVPAGTTGLQIPVTVTYNPVLSAGQGGITTRSVVRLNMISYKATVGSATTVTPVDVQSNPMVLVASVPTVSKAADTPLGIGSGYAAGAGSEVLRFTVTAGTGDVNLKGIGFRPTYAGSLTNTSTQLVKIYDLNNLNTSLGSIGGDKGVGNSGQQSTYVFDTDYLIPAGQTKEFVVTADTTNLNTQGNSFRMDLTATTDTTATANGNAGDWRWNDGTVASGTYGNGYLVKNLPVTGNTFVR